MARASVDLAHVAVFDPARVSATDAADQAALTARATASFQALHAQLVALPRDGESRVRLPGATLDLPRSHPVPVEKPRTRWEQFVANKGLKFEKKEAKVQDEATGEWRLRWGQRRGAGEDWLAEVPNDVNEDPFGRRDAEQRAGVAEQRKRERRNRSRAERVVAVSSRGSFRKEELRAAVRRASRPGSSPCMNQFNDVADRPAIFEDGSGIPKLLRRHRK